MLNTTTNHKHRQRKRKQQQYIEQNVYYILSDLLIYVHNITLFFIGKQCIYMVYAYIKQKSCTYPILHLCTIFSFTAAKNI